MQGGAWSGRRLLTSLFPQPVPQGFSKCPQGGPSAHHARSTAWLWRRPLHSACARIPTLARPLTHPQLPAPVSAPPGWRWGGGETGPWELDWQGKKEAWDGSGHPGLGEPRRMEMASVGGHLSTPLASFWACLGCPFSFSCPLSR